MSLFRFVLSGFFAASFAVGLGFSHSGSHGSKSDKVEQRTVASSADQEKARQYFTDTTLITHDGKDVRFYSDMLKDRTVVVSFTFTSCEDACPLINATLQRVQERLADRLGRDIYFVSITVDPKVDTPETLARYRKQFKAREGWVFLTGSEKNIETVSEKMGQVFERDAHLTALLVGNTKAARWRKIPAHLSDAVIASQIVDIADGIYD